MGDLGPAIADFRVRPIAGNRLWLHNWHAADDMTFREYLERRQQADATVREFLES